MDFLVVDFDEAAANEMGLRCIILCDCDYLTEGTGNDAAGLLAISTTHHGVGLTAACLPISKDSAIVSIKHTFNQGKSTLLIDRALCRFGGKYTIKREAFWLLFRILFD